MFLAKFARVLKSIIYAALFLCVKILKPHRCFGLPSEDSTVAGVCNLHILIVFSYAGLPRYTHLLSGAHQAPAYLIAHLVHKACISSLSGSRRCLGFRRTQSLQSYLIIRILSNMLLILHFLLRNYK